MWEEGPSSRSQKSCAFDEGIAVVVPQWDDRDHKIQPLLGNLSYLKHFKTELEKPKDETIFFLP